MHALQKTVDDWLDNSWQHFFFLICIRCQCGYDIEQEKIWYHCFHYRNVSEFVRNIFASWEANFVSAAMFSELDKQRIDRKHDISKAMFPSLLRVLACCWTVWKMILICFIHFYYTMIVLFFFRLFENFVFSHFVLFESNIHRSKRMVEKSLLSSVQVWGKSFQDALLDVCIFLNSLLSIVITFATRNNLSRIQCVGGRPFFEKMCWHLATHYLWPTRQNQNPFTWLATAYWWRISCKLSINLLVVMNRLARSCFNKF